MTTATTTRTARAGKTTPAVPGRVPYNFQATQAERSALKNTLAKYPAYESIGDLVAGILLGDEIELEPVVDAGGQRLNILRTTINRENRRAVNALMKASGKKITPFVRGGVFGPERGLAQEVKHPCNVYLTSTEQKALRQAALKSGYSHAAVVLSCVTGGKIKTVPVDPNGSHELVSVCLWLTNAEHAFLKDAAKKAGLPVMSFIQQATFGQVTKPIRRAKSLTTKLTHAHRSAMKRSILLNPEIGSFSNLVEAALAGKPFPVEPPRWSAGADKLVTVVFFLSDEAIAKLDRLQAARKKSRKAIIVDLIFGAGKPIR